MKWEAGVKRGKVRGCITISLSFHCFSLSYSTGSPFPLHCFPLSAHVSCFSPLFSLLIPLFPPPHFPFSLHCFPLSFHCYPPLFPLFYPYLLHCFHHSLSTVFLLSLFTVFPLSFSPLFPPLSLHFSLPLTLQCFPSLSTISLFPLSLQCSPQTLHYFIFLSPVYP